MISKLFGTDKTKLDEIKNAWDGIVRNVQKTDKKECI
jgi:hypothetical protein